MGCFWSYSDCTKKGRDSMSDTPTAISMWILPSQRNSSKFMKSAKFYLSLKFNFLLIFRARVGYYQTN